MLKNYIKIALRNLLRNKLFSILNIAGLVIGMVACLLILQYVRFEMSYDTAFENSENIYRVHSSDYQNGKLVGKSAATFLTSGPTMKKDFPEVVNYTSIQRTRNAMLAYGEKRFKEKALYYVAPTFFEVFSFKLLKGNANTVLSKPGSIVLTEKNAKKYFGNQDPIGKSLELNGKKKFRVTGVVQNPPANTHLQFNFLLSNHRLLKDYRDKKLEWIWSNFHTYVVLNSGDKAKEIEARFPAYLKRYLPPEDLNSVKLHLQPIADIHLNGFRSELTASGDKQATYLLLLIAVFILIIAWINYVNLATARATDRAKEVGIRKVIGAYRKQLITQFLGESFLLNLLACAFTVLLADLLMPVFENFTGTPMNFDLWRNWEFWGIFGVMFLIGVVFSGMYPAFVLSSFKPVTVLKGKIIRSPKGIALRKGLTLFQFAASITLIGGTIAVYQQLRYMRGKDLGIDINQTLIVEGPQKRDKAFATKSRSFKQQTEQLAYIQNISSSSTVPGRKFNANITGIKIKGQSGDGTLQHLSWIDTQYIPAYGLKLLAGRNFSIKNKSEKEKSVIINKASAKLLGYSPEKIINKKLQYDLGFGEKEYTIVGVVNDFHQKSLKEATMPALFHYHPNAHEYYSIKLNAAKMQEAVALIKAAYLKKFPKNTFEYFFLDVAFDAQYKADEQFGRVFTVFSALAIFVACMGLFGLVSFSLLQRTKELGIRKVLGASSGSLMTLLLRDFLKPIALAGIVALPFMYWGVNLWLQNFAYHISIGWWLFVLPILIVGIIALLTIGFQAFRATRNNPVDSLRCE